MENFQSFNDDKVQVQPVDFGSLTMRREDFVMTLHMITFPTSSHVGVADTTDGASGPQRALSSPRRLVL